MTIIAKTTLAAMKMPLTVEKDGQRYSLDIADDEQGLDLVVEREEGTGNGEQGTGKREEGTGSGLRATVAILAALLSTAALADRTANQGWVTENFVSRTNEWKLAERRHALFILDLNAENGGKWRSFELKASTNNFTRIPGTTSANMCFWSCSDEADGYADAALPLKPNRPEDRMRLFWLTSRGAEGRDGRAWTRIATTLDLEGAYPKFLAVLVSPELCADGGWLSEENGDAVWCYARADASGSEKDTNGKVIWHPAVPVRWYRKLPEWAN